MALGPAPVLGAGGEPKSKIKDIEPLLKWAAVAYGAGFLTVMLHTYRLGVPVVQLIEPIYVWVGLPLAVVLYFIRQLISAFRRTREKLRNELEEVKRDYDALQAINTPEEASEALLQITRTIFSLFDIVPLFPVFAAAGDLLISLLRPMIGKQLAQSSAANLVSYVRKISSRLLFLADTTVAVYRFSLRVLILASIRLVVCTFGGSIRLSRRV